MLFNSMLISFIINAVILVTIIGAVNTVDDTDTNIIESVMLEKNSERKLNHRYNFDQNYHLNKLHSTPEAKLFLEGCRERYSVMNVSNYMQRNISVENPDDLIILGIFTLDEFSILLYFEDSLDNSDSSENYVNITLGINKNSNSTINGTTHFDSFSFNDDDYKLPAMPYYIAINTSNSAGEVQVSELRNGNQEPFLKYKQSDERLKPTYFRIDHVGAIYAHYSCCESHCKRQIFQRISGCNKYSTHVASTQNKFDLDYYYKDVDEENDSKFMFSGNFFIDRPENTSLAAKFKFYEFNDRPGDYYEIVLTDTKAIIYQHVFSENATVNTTLSFLPEPITPVAVNITITKGGRVSLTRPRENKSFLTYQSARNYKKAVNVKFVSITKLRDDGIRYDFYYNCSDVLTYFNETPRSPATEIITKFVRRLNESRYDLVQIFNETFHFNEKYGKYYNEEVREFDDIEVIEVETINSINGQPSDGNSSTEYIKRTLTGGCSFLFVVILKWVSSFECVKNMMRDHDEEKVKEYRKKIGSKFGKEVTDYFGDE